VDNSPNDGFPESYARRRRAKNASHSDVFLKGQQSWPRKGGGFAAKLRKEFAQAHQKDGKEIHMPAAPFALFAL